MREVTELVKEAGGVVAGIGSIIDQNRRKNRLECPIKRCFPLRLNLMRRRIARYARQEFR